MIERAIENWLINAGERNYQIPFCQVLLSKGHKVIYVSSHRPMEQGKDIVTIDNEDNYCAYQLKTGKLDIPTWRRISGEIEELIELPIIHPSVDKSKPWKSFLVTNGEVIDEVRIQIDQRNDDNLRRQRGYSYLDIIDGHTLLGEFINSQGNFIPRKLEDFDAFLRLFLADGTDYLPKAKFFEFLNNTVLVNISNRQSDPIDAISSSVIITGYLLSPYQIQENHYALFEAWTALGACIVRHAEKSGIGKEDWIDSFRLVNFEIIRNLSLLKEETLARKDFLEGDWLGDGGLVYRARATIVLGTLATLELHFHSTDKEYVPDKRLLGLVKDSINTLWFWGESAFPCFFNLINYLEFNNEAEIARSLLDGVFLGLVGRNSDRAQTGLPNSYYSIIDVLGATLGTSTQKIDFGQFSGSSHILEAMILMIARRDGRSLLETNWGKLSHIQFEEFRPERIEDTFLWRANEGSNHSEFPKQTQSWAKLIQEARSTEGVPNLYSENLELLRFFILICPHRTNKSIIGLLDQNH